ncbi:16S rRNA (guanine(966)-N(2))-methyltransferase RsmD [Breznakia sp. OttesenSCG-928-G09]|nr:16S rRNA (guanine(966)-N(2))-methyltransferase RsmD [Breznakia sp. OttesenSCG-928-G09]
MRITAGEYRSRRLKSLDGDSTRPTSDKVKEAIFSSIGPYFDGGVLLDLFGGSGGITLEAISRGMEEAYVCDKNKKAIEVIKENVRALDVHNCVKIIQGDYKATLQKLVDEKFDIVFLDPPYAMDVSEEIIAFLIQNEMLYAHSVIIVESKADKSFSIPYKDLEIYKEKHYGISKVTYFRGK